MATGRIEFDDLIQQGNPFADAITGAETFQKVTNSIVSDIKKNKKEFESLGGAKTGANLKKVNKELTQQDANIKALVAVNKQELNGRAKLSAAMTTQAKVVAELTVKNQQQAAINKNLARINLAQAGSYEKLNAQVIENTRRAKTMEAVTKKQKAARDKLIKTIKTEKAELKKLDKTMGDSQREVGAYSEGIQNAAGQMGIMGGVMPKLAAGLKLLKLGFTTLKGAIISTGLGALVILIISLVTWFKKTVAGGQALERAMAPLKAIFDVMMNVIGRLGAAMGKLFEGDVVGAWNDTKAAVSGVNDELKEQITLYKSLAERAIVLRRDKRVLIELEQTLNSAIAASRLAARDETATINERIASQKNAIIAVKSLAAIKKKILIEELDQLRENVNATLTSEADLESLALKRAEIKAADEEADTKQLRLVEFLKTLNNQAAKEQIQQLELIKTAEQLQTESLETEAEKRVEIRQREAADSEKVFERFFAAQDKLRKIDEAQAIAATGRVFGAAAGLAEQNTATFKILKTAQAIIATYTGASQALAEPFVPTFIKFANAAAITLSGLANVAKINKVNFWEGTDSVQGGTPGKDSVAANVAPKERIVSVKHNRPLLAMGVTNSELPGLASIGRMMQGQYPRLTAIAGSQLNEQRETNRILNKHTTIDSNGVITDLSGQKTYLS